MNQTATARLCLHLLGRPQAYLDEQPLQGLAYAKVQALLYYLATETHTAYPRVALAGMFWPAQTEPRALQNLRQALTTLRRALATHEDEQPFLLITRQSVQFNPHSNFWCDVHAFTMATRQAAETPASLHFLEQAAHVYQNDFLSHFTFSGCLDFEEWVTQRREALHIQAVEVLMLLYKTYERQNQRERAIAAARRLLDLEPWQEEAHQALMRLHIADGRFGAAIQQYQRCTAVLHDELSMSPNTATLQLYEYARAHDGGAVAVVHSKDIAADTAEQDMRRKRLAAWCQTNETDATTLARLTLDHARNGHTSDPEVVRTCLVDAIELLGEQSWQQNYTFMLQLYTEAARIAALSKAPALLERLILTVRNHARSLLDTLDIVLLQIEYLTRRQQARAAVHAALPMLAMFGIPLPEHATPEQVQYAYQEVQQMLAERDLNTLLMLPEMTDDYSKAAMRLLHALYIPALIVHHDLSRLIGILQMKLLLQRGTTIYTPFVVATYGKIHGLMADEPALGYPFGQLALRYLEQHNYPLVADRTRSMVLSFLAPWKRPLRRVLADLHAAEQRSKTGKDFMASLTFIHSRNFAQIICGLNLTEALEEVNADLTLTRQAFVDLRAVPTTYVTCYIRTMVGQSEDVYHLYDTAEEDAHLFAHLHAVGNRLILFIAYTTRMMLRYVFEDYNGAAADMVAAEPYAASAEGLLRTPVFCFYQSLVLLALPARQRSTYDFAAQVRQNQERMRRWSHHAPENFLHKWHLVEAERCRVHNHAAQALHHYDAAIALALQHEFFNIAALSAERARLCAQQHGQSAAAARYTAQAHTCYMRWGATARVQRLAAAVQA